MAANELLFLPLGGLGGIGKNCTVLEYEGEILVIDVGIEFPSEEMFGVDVVIPDFGYLVENQERIRGIVVTHGHEDHIGGLPFLLDRISAPVYATPLTRGLIEVKLNAEQLRRAQLQTILAGQTARMGQFEVTPFHVNHSIPDAVGLAIRTPAGLVVHTGDFKIDHTPVEGEPADLGQLARLSAEGVLLLLSDSTNAETPGYTLSESRLRDTFERVFAHADGRIIVATFASLLSRIQMVIETAAAYGRKVAVAGRSMEQNTAIAQRLGYLHWPADTQVPLSAVNDLPDEQVVIIATGSQGEINSALARMASGRFREVRIREGDTVLISAKAIPGNETAIHRNVDNLFRRGADVVYGPPAGLHVSGHAAQEELKFILNLLRPVYFVPVHGAYRMLVHHARLAHELGMPPENVFVLDNGDRLYLSLEGAHLGEPIPAEGVMVDGDTVGDVGPSILRDRLTLAQDGVVVAKVAVDGRTGKVARQPEIVAHGFVYLPEAAELIDAANAEVVQVVEAYQGGSQGYDANQMSLIVERRLGSFFRSQTGRNPVIVAVVSVV
ncbi:MAG: ribonuclease J [Anaerolineae bacterium]|jgi:ribonuclease J|nr:ribonuclease J [Chloroflexota bacterium]